MQHTIPLRRRLLAASLCGLAVTVVAVALAAPRAHASAGLSDREVESQVIKAANRYTYRNFGVHRLSGWSALCWRAVPHRYNFWTFSCRVSFNDGQCTGRMRFSERQFRAYGIRIGCGE